MRMTLLLTGVFIFSVCLLIYALVALIQNRKLLFTAPKDIQAAAKDHPERCHGAHALGWKLVIISLFLMVGSFVYGGYDGGLHGFGFWQYWLRFSVMLYLWKVFDIICLDWLLLTKSHFFQYYYPETSGCQGYHQFGFNRREQTIRIVIFPFAAALMAAASMWMAGTL